MKKKNGLTIAVRSWKRAGKVYTHEYFKDTQYVVASSQADGYRKTGVNVWECPDSAQGNLCRVTNWIIDNCPTKWLIITDDDLSWIGRYNGNKHKKLSEQEAIEQIENSFLLAEELGVPFWGMNCIPDKGAYREYTPFSFNNYIGGPFQGFILPDFDLRYDERLYLKEDYDMTLQVCNKWRKALRVNYLNYNVKQQEGVGGCSDFRNLGVENEQFELLQKKWGSNIVKKDNSNKSGKGKLYDINPILKVPINGV